MTKTWVIGTRGSKLAITQTELVVSLFKRVYPDFRFTIKTIRTTGDTVWDKPLHLVGGKGLFVKEIEEALLKGEIHMAVHSMKDLPSDLEKGLFLGAVLEREDPRDVFISTTHGSIKEIDGAARIGTSSLRRKSQLLQYNKAIEIVPLRGNVDTRIRKLTSLSLQGIILAYAGVKRMGLEGHIREILPLDLMVPSPGQGAIGIEAVDTVEMKELLKPLNHDNTFREISLERRLQSHTGGGCRIPLGINTRIQSETVVLHISLGTEDGGLIVKERLTGNISEEEGIIRDALELLKGKI